MNRKDRRHDPETAERVTSIIEAAERAAAALIDKADANAKRYLAEAEAEADRAAAGRLQALVETADALVAQAEAIRRESLRLLESLRHVGPDPQARGREPRSGGPAPQAGGAPQGGPMPQPAAATQAHDQSDVARAKHLAAVPGPETGVAQGPWTGPGPAPAQGSRANPANPGGRAPAQSGNSAQPGNPGVPPVQGAQPHRTDGAAGARLLATQLAVSGSSRQEIAARLRSGFQIEDPNPILDAILGPED